MTATGGRHRAGPGAWVFGVLLASYAFFWHARDWNTASRLMLTYALVDRGTIRLDGLEGQTNDRARFRGHSYTDKLPGYSLLAVPAYAAAKASLGLPGHPRGVPAFRHWPADYWVTLATSGLATAVLGAMLAGLAGELGCGPRRSVLVGLAYGLSTPAYAYATLAYGHQLSALALLGAFRLIRGTPGARRQSSRLGLAGALAATAAVIELQVGPVAAILGFYALGLAIGGRLRGSGLAAFAIGAAGPTLVLLGYNQLAFGSPWDMGYFHEALRLFSRVHSTANPLGLAHPDWSRAVPLLVGSRRGLLRFAPILWLAVPGWIALATRRAWGTAVVSAAACLAIFGVNLSYPEWTGGWSTGPRLLVPLLPFAMLPVAGLLAVGGRRATAAAVTLAAVGGLLMLLFQGIGARVPDAYPDPVIDPVLKLWRGDPLPAWCVGARFERTILGGLWPGLLAGVPEDRRWVQFMPLVGFQVSAIAAGLRMCRPGESAKRTP